MIIVLALILVSGLANGMMDKISFRFSYMHPFFIKRANYWNPAISWRSKWKDGDHTKGEKFLFSSTLLVNVSDGWHLMKSIMLTSWSIVVVLAIDSGYHFVFEYIVVRLFFWIGFSITYKKYNHA